MLHVVRKECYKHRIMSETPRSGFSLGERLKNSFQTFTLCYTPLSNEMRVSVTPKAHILPTHVLKYAKEMNKYLFWASESALESRHRNFIDYYKKL